jgi:hypothetical protein
MNQVGVPRVPAKTNWKSLLKLFQAISLKELDRLQFLL